MLEVPFSQVTTWSSTTPHRTVNRACESFLVNGVLIIIEHQSNLKNPALQDYLTLKASVE